jgi:hypothetical protein
MESFQAPVSFFLTMMFIVVSTILTLISRMKIFEKAGRSAVSAAIPFLSLYVMLRLTGMKKIWTWFYFVILLNIYLTIKALLPLLLPDEVLQDHFSLLSFLYPIIHPKSMNTLFVIYWVFNGTFLFIYIRIHVRLAARFGRSKAFGWGMAFLEPFFYPVLAFGKSEFRQTSDITDKGPLADTIH